MREISLHVVLIIKTANLQDGALGWGRHSLGSQASQIADGLNMESVERKNFHFSRFSNNSESAGWSR